jgi:predicted TIM-barrel fold metal-dependent hydrolase
LRDNYPGRFGGFASIPLPYVEESIEELRFALDELKLDGVCLLTNYDGKYLGDDSFEAFFKELDKRAAVVFVHPTDPGEAYDPKLGISNALVEAPFETTRTVANLIYTGVAGRYRNIRYILAHGGGTIPYVGWRLAMIEYGQKNKGTPVLKAMYDFLVKGGPETGLGRLKDMYYDTALVSGESALRALSSFAGPSKIVIGTDFPFAKVSRIVLKNLRKSSLFSEEEFEAIDYGNCLELFPQLRPPD